METVKKKKKGKLIALVILVIALIVIVGPIIMDLGSAALSGGRAGQLAEDYRTRTGVVVDKGDIRRDLAYFRHFGTKIEYISRTDEEGRIVYAYPIGEDTVDEMTIWRSGLSYYLRIEEEYNGNHLENLMRKTFWGTTYIDGTRLRTGSFF